jgi:hypothetical protein
MKHGMYIMAHGSISTTYFINSFHQSVCLHVHPSTAAGQRLVKHVPISTNTSNNRRIVGRVFFYAVGVVSKERNLFVVLRISYLKLEIIAGSRV